MLACRSVRGEDAQFSGGSVAVPRDSLIELLGKSFRFSMLRTPSDSGNRKPQRSHQKQQD
jgi:hypothetical protein